MLSPEETTSLSSEGTYITTTAHRKFTWMCPTKVDFLLYFARRFFVSNISSGFAWSFVWPGIAKQLSP
jgi:hypothetical protein